jgi:hypothetical protein
VSASNIAAALAASVRISTADSSPAAGKQPVRIFLVDDSDDDIALFRHLLARALPEFPFHLARADTMASALEQLQQASYDVLFLDYQLGGTQAWTFCGKFGGGGWTCRWFSSPDTAMSRWRSRP